MPIIEIKDINGKNVAINTGLIEHIEGANKTVVLEEDEIYSTDLTGNPKLMKKGTSYTMIDWNENVKIVMLNGKEYDIPPEELKLLEAQGQLGLRKRNPLGY